MVMANPNFSITISILRDLSKTFIIPLNIRKSKGNIAGWIFLPFLDFNSKRECIEMKILSRIDLQKFNSNEWNKCPYTYGKVKKPWVCPKMLQLVRKWGGTLFYK